ncbi:hypothetical protein GX408_20180 [bacterium]|nr:hypothetical protein [bacterium]
MKTGDDVEFILFDNGDKVATNKDRFLVYEDVYMGDHSESWIVEKNRETGDEISRHNTRFIASIYWKPKENITTSST